MDLIGQNLHIGCNFGKNMTPRTKILLLAACLFASIGSAASAQFQLSIYGGVQSLPHSGVTGNDPAGVGSFSFSAGWEGNSFKMPPYYGVRGTWWQENNIGYSLDFTHSKAYANDETLAASGFEVLEFTDGINTLTLNAVKRLKTRGNFTPYVGGGLGIAIPNVEVQTSASAPKTFEYQYGGVVAQFQGGVEYDLGNQWSIFGEYKMNYVDLDVDLEGGGSLSTNLVTNAFNIGAGFSF